MNMPLVLLNRRRRGGATAFSPSTLFALAEPGVWFDPSDLTTMFQDRAGTVAVTTPGQFVGVRQDKSGNAAHAVAPTDAARMVYGIEPKTGTRNTLTFTEQFDNAAWAKSSTSVTANAVTAPNSTLTADKLVELAASAIHSTNPTTFTFAASTAYTASVYLKAAERSWAYMQFGTAPFGATVRVWFDLSAGVTGLTQNCTPTIVAVGDGWYRCSITATTTVGGSSTSPIVIAVSTSDATTTYLGDGTSGMYLWGAQLELGATATAYQRVGSAFDVTEAGVDSCHYCQYDGTDDSMSTAAIDFTATDAMSVFAGVWKRSDAALGTLMELSATAQSNAGAFLIRAPATNGTANYQYYGGGTVRVVATAAASFPAPIYNLLTGYNDISADQMALRVNGAQVATSTSDQGTGNFGNYPLYIGRRNNASNPFSGRDYGIIVVGKTLSAGDLASTEAWLAAKTPGVSL